MRHKKVIAGLFVLGIWVGLSITHAEIMPVQAQARVVRPVGAAGVVPIPYHAPDGRGSTWVIYQNGWLQQQGNQPLYSQGAMITINGSQPSTRQNQARLDEQTGELVFENMQAGQISITRRILIDRETGFVRYVDILRNNQPQDQHVNVQIQSNLNYGINTSTMIADPRRKGQNIAWTAHTGANRAVVEVFGGKGAKTVPNINHQQGHSMVQAQLPITIPAGKEVALVHLHATVDSMDAGTRLVQELREAKLLASLPSELRRIVINFPASQGFIGDRELLRGEMFDVVEIRGGDQMRGNLKEQSFVLNTFYGTVELPADRIIGMFNVGDFRPRQLLVTMDGEVFGGQLLRETLELELTSGQLIQVPLSQITRVGYRKRPDEPEEWTFDKPYVALRSGDRIGVEMPRQPVEVMTRYGTLHLDPPSISAVLLQAEEHGVHEIRLTDGSRFAGLITAQEFEMKLSGTQSAGSSVPEQVVRFPASAVARIQLAPAPEELDESLPTLALQNNDFLVGSLQGQIRLHTAFDTLTVNAAEIQRLARGSEAELDVQVTLWDSSIVSGQLEDPVLQCRLESGVVLPIPVPLVQQYEHPLPQPAPAMVEKIRAIVQELNADDWKQRDHAEATLTSMGPVVIGVLKELRPSQPPEAQQRIDQILAAVSKKTGD